ncbi:hypothetical protein [Paraburkholderia fungorum]|uniref:hypothetical protein n=1 Tax=Paraburkholderia fungorum TaxID=134537 RepID=UPI001C1EC2B5|nr:hypothetical protein [Paraburkholderia fungorum]MBU7437365.1 hypothetical protein [Paraburkholderia fungorum]
MKSRITIACALALLAGCTSVGHPYPFPKDSEPAADLRIQGAGVYLLTLNEKGCYTGKTSVDGSPGAVPVKVVPGSPLVISYEQNACMMPATFTPQKDAHYLLIAEEGAKPSDPSSSFVGLLMHAPQRQCAVGVFELDGEGQPLKPVKVTAVRPRQTGLTCIKFR